MRALKRYALATGLAAACSAPAIAQSPGFASFSAVVAANGNTVRSLGVQASSNTGTGKYVIEFTRLINGCAYLAGPTGAGGGQASAAPVRGQPKKIEVSTFNRTGVAANSTFTVLVSCPSLSVSGGAAATQPIE